MAKYNCCWMIIEMLSEVLKKTTRFWHLCKCHHRIAWLAWKKHLGLYCQQTHPCVRVGIPICMQNAQLKSSFVFGTLLFLTESGRERYWTEWGIYGPSLGTLPINTTKKCLVHPFCLQIYPLILVTCLKKHDGMARKMQWKITHLYVIAKKFKCPSC